MDPVSEPVFNTEVWQRQASARSGRPGWIEDKTKQLTTSPGITPSVALRTVNGVLRPRPKSACHDSGATPAARGSAVYPGEVTSERAATNAAVDAAGAAPPGRERLGRDHGEHRLLPPSADQAPRTGGGDDYDEERSRGRSHPADNGRHETSTVNADPTAHAICFGCDQGDAEPWQPTPYWIVPSGLARVDWSRLLRSRSGPLTPSTASHASVRPWGGGLSARQPAEAGLVRVGWRR
jgi:hypothetical protein